MPIPVTCGGCGKSLKARDSFAGRAVKCPQCGHGITVPLAEEDTITYTLEAEPAPAPAGSSADSNPGQGTTESDTATNRPRKRARKRRARARASAPDAPPWLRHLHWLLALALIPLAVSLLYEGSAKRDFETRLAETLAKAPPEVKEQVQERLSNLRRGGDDLEELFDVLPGQRLAGAALPRQSWMHWVFATASALLFMSFFVFLGVDGSADPLPLLGIGLFTATIGIMLLLSIQVIAVLSPLFLFCGPASIFFLLLKFIAFSYWAALDPANGFLLSFLGFTCGVGFCEEVCKVLPLLWFTRARSHGTWRGAFLWGLASGAGFGISEGISYASSYYNGIGGLDIYAVRFLSCVALHAVWAGVVAITLQQNRGLLEQDTWLEFFAALFLIVGVPMVLHGLYDTFLKKEMNAAALGVAVVSFLYLAYLISHLRGSQEDDDETPTIDYLHYGTKLA